MSIPTVTVEIYLADFATWSDVSAKVLKSAGLTMTRGRSNEFETSSPGTCSFTLANPSPGTDYGLNSLNYAYGLLRKNNLARVKIGSLQVWQGRIDKVTWNPGAPGASTVSVTCTDESKTYAKAELYPFAVETCKADVAWTGGASYPFVVKVGGVGSFMQAHRDPSAARARIRLGSAGKHEYNEDGPPHVRRALKLLPRNGIGPVMEHPTTWNPASEYGLVSFWFRTTVDESVYLFDMRRTSGGSGYFSITLNSGTGRLTFAAAGDSGGSVNVTDTTESDLFDGAWHHVAAWLHPKTGGTELRYYIDGGLKTVAYSATAITIGSSNRKAVVGGFRTWGTPNNSLVINGEIANPAIWLNSAVSDQPAYWFDDGMEGGPGLETIPNQITDLRNFVDLPSVATANLSGYNIAGQFTDGKSYLDCLQELAETELGVFYMDRLGDPKLRGFGARSSGSSVVLTLNKGQDISSDLSLVLDDATYANTVRATSPAGTVLRHDSALVTDDDAPLVVEWTALTEDETDLETMADNLLNLRKTNTPRIGKVTVDLLTTPNAIESTTLQLVPLDRVRISDLDADMFGATTYDGFVEGWELTVSMDEYTVALDLSPVI